MSIYSVESQLNGEGMIDTGEKKKKPPLGKYHCNNCCRQEISMDAKIIGWKSDEKQDFAKSQEIFLKGHNTRRNLADTT